MTRDRPVSGFWTEFVVFDFQSLCVFVNPITFSEPPGVSPEAGNGESSAWEANFACKQKSHYGEEDGEDKQHVRGADHCVVGQLVRLASHLVDIEAYGEDERRHAEQDHWKEGAKEKMLVYS